MSTTYNAGTVVMAERVRRATGRTVTVENTGGGTMVAVVTTDGPAVIAFHPEGYAVYADMVAWRDGEDAVHADSTTPLDTVTAVAAWLDGGPADTPAAADEVTTYVLTDGEVQRQSVHATEDDALAAHTALTANYAGDYRDGGQEVTVVTAYVKSGAVVASTTMRA